MVTQINTIINSFLKNKHKELLEEERVKKIVGKVLDSKTKKHIQFIKIYKKNLVFYTDSSAGVFQLNLLKNKILQKVHQIIPEIERIKIKIGQV